jgi:hypothetical protein
MKNTLMRVLIAASLVGFAGATMPTTDAFAASKRSTSVYDNKKAECTRKADQRKWGIHRIQRSNWIKNCIARG